MALEAVFWILAVMSVAAALAVVLLKDIFRAALFLVFCFFTVAGIYATLNADFLAVVQVLVYVGAVGILLIFAILFTRETQHGSLFNRQHMIAMLFAGLLLAAMIYTMTQTDWVAFGIFADPPATIDQGLLGSGKGLTQYIGEQLFSEDGFIITVEIAGIMLLAAVLGGIVIMSERDKK